MLAKPKPLVRLDLPPAGGEATTLYAAWFCDAVDLLVSDADADFLTELILGLRREQIDARTALFAETDLLINGWHTADTAQPDRTELHRFWTLVLTRSELLTRNN